MKSWFSIVVGLIILFGNTIVPAAPPSKSTAPVTVRLKIHNQSSVASLTYWSFSYTRSFPDMPSYMPALFPVNPSLSGSLSLKIPTKPTPISASLVYGYDFSNFCLFLFSYSNNQLIVTPTPHGGVDCGTPVVFGKVVTIVINQRREQQSAPTPAINSESIDVTVRNNSAASLNVFNYASTRNASFPLPQPLQKISGYSKKVFSIPVEPSPSSQYLLYGYNDNDFCKFQFLLSSSNAVSVKTVTQQENIRCFVSMSGNSPVINIVKVQNITIHIQNNAVIPAREIQKIPMAGGGGCFSWSCQ